MLKASNLQQHIKEVNTSEISSNIVVISASDILQKQKYLHELKHYIAIALCSIVPIIFHKFYNSSGHQGTIHSRP